MPARTGFAVGDRVRGRPANCYGPPPVGKLVATTRSRRFLRVACNQCGVGTSYALSATRRFAPSAPPLLRCVCEGRGWRTLQEMRATSARPIVAVQWDGRKLPTAVFPDAIEPLPIIERLAELARR